MTKKKLKQKHNRQLRDVERFYRERNEDVIDEFMQIIMIQKKIIKQLKDKK